MFKKKEADYRKVCLYCENASPLPNSDEVICKTKGVVSEDYSCRKFLYDPLKRIPNQAPKLPSIDPDDLL